ncbi:MAG: protein kinase [Candidatus Sumerlaeia bacterium]|nr:protein kinase [Candidatus Sumerlaeia bacterium]
MTDLLGQDIAGFRIVREIGRGGMGVVFEAEQIRLGRPVALKMLHPALTVDGEFLRRFEREAKTLARLNHENIVNVIDFFCHNDRWFLALEFVEGETLARRLRRCARRRRFFAVAEAAAVVWQIAQALAFAHDRQIIHRDLKPDNIMLTSRGRAKVMDFGIARIAEGTSATEVGVRIGTPDYMSPEQLHGRPADARSDLFSLGVIFYEMILGQRPFSQSALLRASETGRLELVWDAAALPPGGQRIQPIVERLLQLNPDERYPSAADLLSDMRQRLGTEFLGDEAWTTPPVQATGEAAVGEAAQPPAMAGRPAIRRRWIWLAAAAGLVAVVLAVFLLHQWDQSRLETQRRALEAQMANFQAFIADSQGRATEAETLLLRAIDVEPTVARYWRDLGDYYVKYGHPDKAVFYYRKTLELDPADEETSRRLKTLLSAPQSD